ncbi:beta-2 adrenergic receptor-like isoform X2 [Ostrea edulis]|nr:beta-2 adrenergic receptor-like isoform X2 [Ostrea edulis]XP_048755647.2 beta-2 adrenergic receptor-like isoform X2 [Ostrea edulis]XP_048755648.2 beta-2 adrenergic receptor-like isoform X2 [Ostrea edulis]
MTNDSTPDPLSLHQYEDNHDIHLNWTLFMYDIETAHDAHSTAVAVYAVVLSFVSIVLNSVLCVVIFFTKELRCRPLYACVLNFCIINLLMGVIVNPLVTYHELSPVWALGTFVCDTWIIMDVLLPFTSLMTLLLLSIDRLMFVRMNTLYKSAKFRFQREVYVILPWLLGVVIVLPIWIGGFQKSPFHVTGMCVFGLVDEASISSPILVYFLPALIIVLVMVCTHLFSFRDSSPEYSQTSTRSAGAGVQTGYYAYESHFSVVTLYFVNVTFLIMWAPFHIMSLLLAVCVDCMPPYSLILGFTYMGATASSLISLLWLTDYHIRYSLKHIRERFRKQTSPPSTTVTLTLLEA